MDYPQAGDPHGTVVVHITRVGDSYKWSCPEGGSGSSARFKNASDALKDAMSVYPGADVDVVLDIEEA